MYNTYNTTWTCTYYIYLSYCMTKCLAFYWDTAHSVFYAWFNMYNMHSKAGLLVSLRPERHLVQNPRYTLLPVNHVFECSYIRFPTSYSKI